MNYARSALTYGAAFFLIGLLVLLFGGLFLNGEARPPTGTGTHGIGWSAVRPGPTSGQTGLLLAGLCFGLGMLLACWARASWEETTVLLVACAGSLWLLSPGGMEGVWELLRQISWIWENVSGENVFGKHSGIGWAAGDSAPT